MMMMRVKSVLYGDVVGELAVGTCVSSDFLAILEETAAKVSISTFHQPFIYFTSGLFY
jgi:hypothetical protein